MLDQQGSISALEKYFRKNKFATMKDIRQLINTNNSMSVYRRLQDVNYISSFSDAGKYYTLKAVANFDSSGLWLINDIGFSCYGNLKKTLTHIIEKSESGKTYQELEKQLKVNLKNSLHNALLDLVKSQKISRTELLDTHVYLYTHVNKVHAKNQITHRTTINMMLSNNEYADWVVIEILGSVIRTNQITKVELSKIASDLVLRNIILTQAQIKHVLDKFNLKKTLGLP